MVMRCARRWRRNLPPCGGTTLVEVMVAATVLIVVVWGAVAFAVSSRTAVERASQQRTAAQVANERLERARAAGYASLANSTGSVTVASTLYTWTLTVASARADPADANSTYKTLQMSVDWASSGGSPVVVRTAMSP